MSNGEKDLFRSLLEDIKKKRELASLGEDFVIDRIREYIKENPKILHKKLDTKIKKSREYRGLVKDIRRKLRIIYGIYYFDVDKGRQLLDRLKLVMDVNDEDVLNTYSDLLSLHPSTEERMDKYPLVYKRIFDVTGKPNSILDLGSGLNPLSYIFMGLEKVDYVATELTKKEVDFLNDYFKIMGKYGLNGKAMKIDLLQLENYKKLNNVDVCFMFKLLESLEFVERDISKKIIKLIPAKYIVVSFSTKSLSGVAIRKKGRKWFRALVKDFKAFNVGNELFYVIKK